MEEKKDTSYLFRPVIKPAVIPLSAFPLNSPEAEALKAQYDEEYRQEKISELQFALNSYLSDDWSWKKK